MFFGSRDTSVTSASIIDALFKLKYDRPFVEDQCINLGEDRAASVSMGKRKIGKEIFDSLCNSYKVLASGGIFTKHKYMFRIDASKMVSLMHNLQENLHLKSCCLHNVTIAGLD